MAGIFIVEVVKGTPAYASKQLKAGDEVIYINNVNVTHLLLPQVLLLLLQLLQLLLLLLLLLLKLRRLPLMSVQLWRG